MMSRVLVDLVSERSRIGVQTGLLYSHNFDIDGLLVEQPGWNVYRGTCSACTLVGRVFLSITNTSGDALPSGQSRLGFSVDGTVATLDNTILSLDETCRVVIESGCIMSGVSRVFIE